MTNKWFWSSCSVILIGDACSMFGQYLVGYILVHVGVISMIVGEKIAT